ncbi:MAG: hydroxymethylbilane synthase [Cyclobacteriaceae bacterium]
MKIRIGTRGSKLALWQAHWVAGRLKNNGFVPEIITISTKGDQMLEVSMSKIGSKGVFTQELEDELLAGSIDLAVHSAKDLPSELPMEFELVAFSQREYPGDVLVARGDLNLNEPRVLGTSSTRRIAMIKHYYPAVEVVPIRGNVPTRIQKMQDGACDGLLLAYAGVHRLNFDHLIREKLLLDRFVPAVGQGSIAVEISSDLETATKEGIRRSINHPETESCVLAERGFLKVLQGGCSIPAFSLCQSEDNLLTIIGGIISLDGTKMIRETFEDQKENAVLLGENLARSVLSNGGAALLEEIKEQL